jgi:IclR family transcriptional regulator, mhp operon transcriptional activator
MQLEPEEDARAGAVRSIHKALELLDSLAGLGGVASTGRLAAAANLPKSTVRRIMQTLIGCGYVRQASARTDYCLTSRVVRLSEGFFGLPAVLEAAYGPLERLTETVLWPASLAVRRGSVMEVAYSTLASSPYGHARPTFGKHLPLGTSAHGKAWLAALGSVELDAVLPLLSAEETIETTAEKRAMVQTMGFAMRSRGRDPATNTIATPVVHAGAVVATVGLTFFSRVVTRAEMEDLGGRLRATAAGICESLQALGGGDGNAVP